MAKILHYIDQNTTIYSIGKTIYLNSIKLKIDGILPDIFSLIKRLLRNEIFTVSIYKDIVIVIVKKNILFFKNAQLLSKVSIDRGSRPLKQGVAYMNGKLYYGDYWGNPNRNDVYLYEIDLCTFQKKIIYSFSNIRHIHFVKKDNLYKNTLLIGTGDLDSESALLQLNLNDMRLHIIARGSQKFRAVSVLQKGTYLLWGSDAPDYQNYIYCLNRKTKELKSICKIEGPAYYSTINKKGEFFIATTIENRHKHKAIIYKSSDGGNTWTIYKSFKKDIWHSKYFGYGVIEFVEGQQNIDELQFNTFGLKEINE